MINLGQGHLFYIGFYMGKVKTMDFLKTVAASDLQTTYGVDEGM